VTGAVLGALVGVAAAGLVAGYRRRGPFPQPRPLSDKEEELTRRCDRKHRRCGRKGTNHGCGCCPCCLNTGLYPDGCGCTGCKQPDCVCSRSVPTGVHCRECA